MILSLFDTLAGKKRPFSPLEKNHVRIYVCGPTVYDFAHVGNARPMVVFDVLVRLLRRLYKTVTYVRNITDIDDKIIAAADQNGQDIKTFAERFQNAFIADMDRLDVKPPDHAPCATDHIDDMIAMITTLIDDRYAYCRDGHVLFSVAKAPDYGLLSKRSAARQRAGAGARPQIQAQIHSQIHSQIQAHIQTGGQADVHPQAQAQGHPQIQAQGQTHIQTGVIRGDYKRDSGDFVLWKPSPPTMPGWDSPWGRGRPGWHIECSAMSHRYLKTPFDIHGGGADLIFPHHENEMAQSCCALNTKTMANFWIHNGYLTMEGEKMSKSLGNVVTIRDACRIYRPEVVRALLLSSHYRHPLDWNRATLEATRAGLNRLYQALADSKPAGKITDTNDDPVVSALLDDLNTPAALAALHACARRVHKANGEEKIKAQEQLRRGARLLGLLRQESRQWFQSDTRKASPSEEWIDQRIALRQKARREKNYALADTLREELEGAGIILEDNATETRWKRNDR